jgi:hypothetical protein
VKTPALSRIFGLPLRLIAKSVALIASAVVSFAGPNDVFYGPLNQSVEGIMPFSKTYSLSIISPANFPVATSRAVNLELSATTFTEGDEATALGYVTFIDSATLAPTTTVTFTSPGQLKTVTVRVAIPLIGITGTGSSATFAYRIATSNWGTMSDGNAAIDGGSNINAIASVDPLGDPNRLPPTVAISTPTDGQIFTPSVLPTSIPLSFVGSARPGFPVLSVDATLDGNPITVVSTPAGSATSVTGSASLQISAPGTYTVRANARNSVGDATDTNSFTVVFGGPPVATITTPINGASYSLLSGSSLAVPFTFSATSPSGPITALDVQLDGAVVSYSSTPLGQAQIAGSLEQIYTTGGPHTLTVTATNAAGVSQVATTTFNINLVLPTPNIGINLTNGSSYTIPSGGTSVSVPFTLQSTTTTGFKVETVTATWSGGSAPVLSHTPALGISAAVTSSGSLLNVGPGTYTLTAVCTSGGVGCTDSVTFTVNAAVQQPLPSVVINTPPVGSTYSRTSMGPAINIPLTFTGTSNATNGVITGLTAKLNTTNLPVTATNIGQKVATGAATMTVSAAGTYTITVTAVDAYGSASATRTFTVTVVQPKCVSGTVFYDVDADGSLDCAEFGLAGVAVNIVNSAGVTVGTASTNSCGSYSFSVAPGTYSVVAVPYAGLKATTTASRSITVSSSNVCVSAIGLGLNFTAIRTMTANGLTIGYWKNNLDKAISGKTNGIQVPASTLSSYTCKIGDFALTPYDNITMKSASSTMGSNSSVPKDLLSKQLIASEFNYQNAAYIGGNKNLTFVFLWWGEYVLKNSTSYSSTYLIWTKDWFDAYNNSHGGVVAGPN